MGRYLKIAGILIVSLLSVNKAIAEWYYKTSIDRMTDKKNCIAYTDLVKSLEPMNFPYTGTKSRMFIVCSENFKHLSECSISFAFTSNPNISNIEFDEIGTYFKTRIRFDKEPPEVVKMYIMENFLFVNDVNKILKGLKKGHKSLLVELNWFGNGRTYFRYPISGASEILEKLKEGCQINRSKKESREEAKEEPKITDTINIHNSTPSGWIVKKFYENNRIKGCHIISESIEPIKAPENASNTGMKVRLACTRNDKNIEDCSIDFLFDNMPQFQFIEKGVVFKTTLAQIIWGDSTKEIVKLSEFKDKNFLMVDIKNTRKVVQNSLKFPTTIKFALKDGSVLEYRYFLKGLQDTAKQLIKKCLE